MAVVGLTPRRDYRVTAYLCAAVGLTTLGLFTGRIEIMAGAAGFTVLLLVGLRDAATVDVGVTCSVAARRMLEGDRVDIALALDHRTGDQIDLAIHSGTGAIRPVGEHSPVVDDTTVVDERSTSRFVTAAYDTIRWGRFDVGFLSIRATRPGCLATWEGSLWDLGPLVVLPKQERLDQLLAPRASHATAGSHPARRFSGDGTDFVDIRPYLPGDRLRDLNWRATARQNSPQINRRMPERGGDVVIVLDALIDGYWTETEVGNALVQRSGQAVWALVRNHLAAQDRVGLLAQSSQSLGWIPPSGGTRARYKILETLLSATRPGSDDDQRPRSRHRTLHDIPPSALVIGVSSLANDEALRSLASLRGHGRAACVLAIDSTGMIEETDQLDPGLLRLAELVFQDRVAYLRRLGTPVVVWRPGQDLDRAVRRLGAVTKRTTRLGMAR